MSANTFELLFGLACVCAGLLFIWFSKTMVAKGIEQHRRMLERPSTEVLLRIMHIIMGLAMTIFGILMLLGKVIK
jgi:threonine/homoserine/homoserine lactone efflux protein